MRSGPQARGVRWQGGCVELGCAAGGVPDFANALCMGPPHPRPGVFKALFTTLLLKYRLFHLEFTGE